MKHTLLSLAAVVPFVLVCACLAQPPSGDFPKPYNSQNPKDILPSPQESLKKFSAPPGYNVSLFAAEPDVQQPIGFTFDDRGRLWVAECYTYAEQRINFDLRLRDRLVIFEDTDNDGRFDKRTVFWDKGQKLTSVAYGFGGAWVLCASNLLFIPDRDRDDVPDGPAVVKLDGFADGSIRHNLVNGLRWGHDGWLYGRHGIQDTSRVAKPGAASHQRVPLNCGIWRYHPTKEIFEVVCHGTTNPWGLDYDDYGEMFFSNTVIGHLWHVVPGAHFKRMYGEDLNPRVYQLIDQCANHVHWDTGKLWHEAREPVGLTDKAGGGHAHAGLMIYLGDNWPLHTRNGLFMINMLGKRLNHDRVVRNRSGYEGVHDQDHLRTTDPWFRGLELGYGPDGGVFIIDWCDVGECHEHDGVHRTSGRIWKVTYRNLKRPTIGDVSKLSNDELVKLHTHNNDYYVRTARRILQERAAAGQDMKAVHAELRKMYLGFVGTRERPIKLRALWTMHAIGGVDAPWWYDRLQSRGAFTEHERVWAIRALVDALPVSKETIGKLVDQAKVEDSLLVKLYLASALQRLPVAARGALAERLVADLRLANDPYYPLMMWYGIEPLVASDSTWAVKLASETNIGLLRRFIARRLTEDLDKNPQAINALLERAAESKSVLLPRDVAQGMTEALRGWRKATPPPAWAKFQAAAAQFKDLALPDHLRELGVVFGDGRALAEVRKIALSTKADGDARRAALRSLIDNRPDDLPELLTKLVGDRSTSLLAIRGLAAYNLPDTPRLLINRFQYFNSDERQEAVTTLTARPAYAKALLQALTDGKIKRHEVSAFHARQIGSLGDEALIKQLAKVWGEVRTTPQEKLQQIAKYKQQLTPARLKAADLPAGRAVYVKACANCHVMYGQGQNVGPDLTGGNRDNLDYLLENLVDPSAVVGTEFTMAIINLKSGRTITGVVGAKTERTLTVQTQTEKLTLERTEIESVQPSRLSLMPDGLLTPLSDDQVRDLVAYLMARDQVPLPGEGGKK